MITMKLFTQQKNDYKERFKTRNDALDYCVVRHSGF